MMIRIASTVQILYDGTDITRYVSPSSCRFSTQFNAMPGDFEMTIVDRERTLSFVSGKELQVKIDGQTLFGGWIFSVTRRFAFPVVRTDNINKVSQRQWVLRGVDFNVLFDKRVLRNPANYLQQLPNKTGNTKDGALLREALVASKYFDVPAGFDVTTEVNDVVCPIDPDITGGDGCDPNKVWAWPQQGSTLRKLVEDLVQHSGAVCYFAPDKKLHHKALEDVEARWGFSDLPNKAAITGSPGFQNATIGPREIEATEEGSVIVNDAMIWGGSEWTGEGETVFARQQNLDSIGSHQRWQIAETHFGELGFRSQRGVNARANVIVNGEPGAVGGDPNRGLRFPQWNIRLGWFAHDVPRIGTVKDHLKAGDLVRIFLHTFGEGGSPLEQVLPLRTLAMSFVGTKPPPVPGGYVPENDEIAYVRFDGVFGLQTSDPYTLWRHLLGLRRSAFSVSTVGGSAPAPYGAMFSGTPTPDPDGTTRTFNLPDGRGYIAGTTDLYKSGLILRRGADYVESNPEAGEIRLTEAPPASDWLWIVCRVSN